MGVLWCCLVMLLASPFEERKLATIPEDLTFEGQDPYERSVKTRFVFARDGSGVAYVAFRDDKAIPMFGDTAGPTCDFATDPAAAPDAGAFAISVGLRGKKGGEETWAVVTDYGTLQPASWVGPPAVGPRGKRVAYWVQTDTVRSHTGRYKRGFSTLAMATWTGSEWKIKYAARAWERANYWRAPEFSPDGSKVAVVVREGPRARVMVWKGRGKGRFVGDAVDHIRRPIWGPKGRSVAYFVTGAGLGAITKTGPMPTVVWKHKKFEVRGATEIVVGPKGRRVAYRFKAKDGDTLAISGVLSAAPVGRILESPPCFSPDGKRVAYTMWGDGGKMHVVDAKTGALLASSKMELYKAADPVFDPAGKRVAFRAQIGTRWHIVVGDKRSPPYDFVSRPRWDPTGTKVAFGARTDRELWWRVWTP